MNCPYCQSDRLIRHGAYKGEQRWKCQNCDRTFLYGMASPPEKIVLPQLNCPSCGSDSIKPFGTQNGKKRFRCRDCDRIFTEGGLPKGKRPKYSSEAEKWVRKHEDII